MSTLSQLLRQVKELDLELGSDLTRQIRALQGSAPFGLHFERHRPESVRLFGQPPRPGDKVHVLPPRGRSTVTSNPKVWHVARIVKGEGPPVAELIRTNGRAGEVEETRRSVEDLVVVAEFRDNIYPGLIQTGEVKRGAAGDPFHTVINGENYHVLEALTYTHSGRVDAIYIDPPYNTGARDWKYNNDYVEEDDAYRHSKWLAFMERRLLVAKKLLNPDDSVLIVTIDEKEVHRLGLLLEQLFPEAAIQCITTVINRKGNARRGEFSRCEEYVFVARFGASLVTPWYEDMLHEPTTAPTKVRWKSLLRLASTGRTTGRFNLFYPLFFDAKSRAFVSAGEPLPDGVSTDSVHVPEGQSVLWPISKDGTDGRWSIGVQKFRHYVQQGYIKFGRPNAGGRTPYYLMESQVKALETGDLRVVGKDADGALELEAARRLKQPMSVWNRPAHSTSGPGTALLRALLPDRRFPYPKSLYAVEDVLRFFVQGKPEAVILDFFAGSGTTAHAVMRLNKQDGGRRQSITVTNNEVAPDEQKDLVQGGLRPGDPEWEARGICDYITKPRITAAITGRTPSGEPIKGEYRFTDEFPMAEGFEANARFFTLTYEREDVVSYNLAFARVAPLLWLRAGSVGGVITEIPERGWDVADSYAVLFDLDAEQEFVEAVSTSSGLGTVFIVTSDAYAFQRAAARFPIEVDKVHLYRSYLSNFAITTSE